MKYLVISRCEDQPHTELLSEDELKKALDEEYKDYEFLNSPPDFEYMPSRSIFIFKGEVVIPRPVETVTQFSL